MATLKELDALGVMDSLDSYGTLDQLDALGLVVKNFSSSLNITATGTSTPTLFRGMLASPELTVTAQSGSSATFVGAGEVSIELTTDVGAKILGEDWIDTDVGTEVWFRQ